MTSYHEKHLSLHQLVVATMIMSPGHSRNNSLETLSQAGGGNTKSIVPKEHLFLIHEIQDHLKRVYNSLCAADGSSTLSRSRFEIFYIQTQHQKPNLPESPLDYTFEDFLLYTIKTKGFNPVSDLPLEEKDLSWPITSYFISSSHNTYLSGNQLSSKSSTESYKNVLRRGCRCIEIDVWNGEVPELSSPSNLSSTTRDVITGTVDRLLEMSGGHKGHLSKDLELLGLGLGISNMALSSPAAPTSPGRPSSQGSFPLGPESQVVRGDSLPMLPMKPEPQVLHGRTLTSSISFRDVCRTIRETAFENNPLPIIISLEVHADWDQQQIMVDIMKEEWNGLLIDKPLDNFDPDLELPTPNDLLNKILIKVKRATRKNLPETVGTNTSLVVNNSNDPDNSGHSASEDERAGKKKGKSGICEALSALGIYTHSAHFDSFEQTEAMKPPHIFSIGESKILDLHQTKRQEMFTHNRNFFMRAYPAGFRINSSNMDPSTFWRKGVQMAALNWQTLDECMMLNEGMFQSEYGWVLKPSGYRSKDKYDHQLEPIVRRTLDLSVTILAAQHIPLPPGVELEDFHPYIKCVLHVELPEDHNGEPNSPPPTQSTSAKDPFEHLRQRTARRRGNHPDFGEMGETLNFADVPNVVEELSFLRIKVVHDVKVISDITAAWACIRLDRLQQGYRFITLLDSKGSATAGLLLVRIKKTLR